MGYTPKLLIDNVSVKLPYRAFAILRKSKEMIENPDVASYQTTPDNDCILLISVREGILLGGAEKICPESNFFSLMRMGPEASRKSVLYS